MKVTEKTRADIAMSIGTLSIKDAEVIAMKAKSSITKVYKALKTIRTAGATIDAEDEVMLSLIELAASRKPKQVEKQTRFENSMRQFSAKPGKQAA